MYQVIQMKNGYVVANTETKHVHVWTKYKRIAEFVKRVKTEQKKKKNGSRLLSVRESTN